MQKIILRLMLAALLLLMPAAALGAASGTANFTVTQADAASSDVIESIQVFKSTDTQRYLYLPAGWDWSALKVWLNTKNGTTLNGVPVASGDVVTCLLPGTTVTVGYGNGKTYQLTVVQERSVGAVFMTTASGSLKKIEAKRGNSETGSVLIRDASGKVICEQPLTQVKGHGNSSFTTFKKKSYQFKL